MTSVFLRAFVLCARQRRQTCSCCRVHLCACSYKMQTHVRVQCYTAALCWCCRCFSWSLSLTRAIPSFSAHPRSPQPISLPTHRPSFRRTFHRVFRTEYLLQAGFWYALWAATLFMSVRARTRHWLLIWSSTNRRPFVICFEPSSISCSHVTQFSLRAQAKPVCYRDILRPSCFSLSSSSQSFLFIHNLVGFASDKSAPDWVGYLYVGMWFLNLMVFNLAVQQAASTATRVGIRVRACARTLWCSRARTDCALLLRRFDSGSSLCALLLCVPRMTADASRRSRHAVRQVALAAPVAGAVHKATCGDVCSSAGLQLPKSQPVL